MKIERRYKFIRTLPPRAPVRTAEWLCRRIGPTALSVVRRFEGREQGMNMPVDVPQPCDFKRNPDWPVDVGIAAGCILGYVFAWLGLVSYFHPNHWVAGVIGSLVGYLVGWLWFRFVRKDVQ